MKLLVKRNTYYKDTTIGEIFVDDKRLAYTLEDTVRATGVKVKHHTAIPEGVYKVALSISSRFKRKLPMIYSEDNKYELKNDGMSFSGIRIHRGNTDDHTSGCILVGFDNTRDKIYNSTSAEVALMSLLEAATDEITLEIVNGQQLK